MTNAERCKAWRQKNPEKFYASLKKWREAHPENMKEINRRAYLKQKERKKNEQNHSETE